MTESDLGHQLLETDPPGGAAARAAGVFVDDQHRLRRPTQLDRPVAQRILPRGGLHVALDLMKRRLAHIHHRASATVRLGDLPPLTHHARPPPAARATVPARASPAVAPRPAASPTPLPPRSPSRWSPTRADPTFAPPFSAEAAPRSGRRDRTPAATSANSRHPVGDPSTPNGAAGETRTARSVQRAGTRPTLPSTSRHVRSVSPASTRQPSTSNSTSRSAPGAATSRTRSGKGSTT